MEMRMGMKQIAIIAGLCIVMALILVIASSVKKSSAGKTVQQSAPQNETSLVLKQRFNGLGWVGVVLFFLSPIISGFFFAAQMNAINKNYYSVPDYSITYAILGFATLLSFILIIIGREFYSANIPEAKSNPSHTP